MPATLEPTAVDRHASDDDLMLCIQSGAFDPSSIMLEGVSVMCLTLYPLRIRPESRAISKQTHAFARTPARA